MNTPARVARRDTVLLQPGGRSPGSWVDCSWRFAFPRACAVAWWTAWTHLPLRGQRRPCPWMRTHRLPVSSHAVIGAGHLKVW